MANLPTIPQVTEADLLTHNLIRGEQSAAATKMDTRSQILQTLIEQCSASAAATKDMRDALQAALDANDNDISGLESLIATLDADTDTSIQSVIAGYEAAELALHNDQPNLFPNNGSFIRADPYRRFSSEENFKDDALDSVEDDFWSMWSAESTDTTVSRHSLCNYQSSTYGGIRAPQTSVAASFSAAISDNHNDTAKLTSTYAIAEVVSGTTITAINVDEHGIHYKPSLINRISPSRNTSVSFWFQSLDSVAYINSNSAWRKLYIDGVEVAGDINTYHKLNQNQIYHICATADFYEANGFTINHPFYLYTKAGTRQRFALMRVAAGHRQLFPHRWPIRSLHAPQMDLYVNALNTTKGGDDYKNRMYDAAKYQIGTRLVMDNHAPEYRDETDTTGKSTSFYMRGFEGDKVTPTWVEVV